jgi:protein gp37
MSENSKVKWSQHTFNPWKHGPSIAQDCDHGYAGNRDTMLSCGTAVYCGPSVWRGQANASNWQEPVRWNAAHETYFAEHGRRQRVFCSSCADVFDDSVDPQWRRAFFDLIAWTPNVNWLLTTKRIGNVSALLPAAWADGWHNVWIGSMVATQAEVDRDVPQLLTIPAVAHFLSVEPMLEPIDLRRYLTPTGVQCPGTCPDTRYVLESEVRTYNAGSELHPLCPHCDKRGAWTGYDAGVDWVVVGGENGYQASPSHLGWLRSVRDQCHVAAVPFVFKQCGEMGEIAKTVHRTRLG